MVSVYKDKLPVIFNTKKSVQILNKKIIFLSKLFDLIAEISFCPEQLFLDVVQHFEERRTMLRAINKYRAYH